MLLWGESLIIGKLFETCDIVGWKPTQGTQSPISQTGRSHLLIKLLTRFNIYSYLPCKGTAPGSRESEQWRQGVFTKANNLPGRMGKEDQGWQGLPWNASEGDVCTEPPARTPSIPTSHCLLSTHWWREPLKTPVSGCPRGSPSGLGKTIMAWRVFDFFSHLIHAYLLQDHCFHGYRGMQGLKWPTA